MVRKYSKIIKYGGILIGLLIAIVVFMAVFVVDSLVKIPSEYTITDSNGCELVTEDVSQYKNWNVKKGEWIEVEFETEKSSNYRDMLVFENYGALVEVYIDDEFVYSNAKTLEEASYKDGLEMLPVNIYNIDTKIRVKFTNSAYNFQLKCPNFYLANEETAYTNYVQRNIIRFGISIIFAILGTICILFGMFKDVFKDQNKKIIILACFCVLNGIGMMLDNNICFIFVGNYKLIYVLRNVSNMLISIMFMKYIIEKDKHKDNVKKMLKIILDVQVVAIIAACLLQLVNLVSFKKTYAIFFVLQIIQVIAYLFMEQKYEKKRIVIKKENAQNIILVLAVLAFIGVNIKVSIFGASNGFVGNTTPYIMVFIICLFILDFIKGRINHFMDKTQVLSLEKLAYIDPLTGIANRNMCEKKFDEIDAASIGQFEIIMFDVKGLKYVNDNFGHKAGDELIVIFSKALKSVFGEINAFIGRMGGDEFVVVIDEEYIDKTNEAFINLDKYIEYLNKENTYKFNIAYHHGISFCDRARNNSVWKKYSSADNNMYENEKK